MSANLQTPLETPVLGGAHLSKEQRGFPSRNGTYMLRADASSRIRSDFQRLAAEWTQSVGHLSSVSERVLNLSYLQIIGLGPPVVPLLLEELAVRPNHWFTALKAITGKDPVPPEHRGRIQMMAQDWLSWAASNGYPDVAPSNLPEPQHS